MKVQVPVWQLNLNVETDTWKDLQKVTGTKDKVCSHKKYVESKYCQAPRLGLDKPGP